MLADLGILNDFEKFNKALMVDSEGELFFEASKSFSSFEFCLSVILVGVKIFAIGCFSCVGLVGYDSYVSLDDITKQFLSFLNQKRLNLGIIVSVEKLLRKYNLVLFNHPSQVNQSITHSS